MSLGTCNIVRSSLKAARQRLSAAKAGLASGIFRFLRGSLKLHRAGHDIGIVTINGCNPGFLNQGVSTTARMFISLCLSDPSIRFALMRQVPRRTKREGSYSYKGSQMLLPDSSFTKNLYQSSFAE